MLVSSSSLIVVFTFSFDEKLKIESYTSSTASFLGTIVIIIIIGKGDRETQKIDRTSGSHLEAPGSIPGMGTNLPVLIRAL